MLSPEAQLGIRDWLDLMDRHVVAAVSERRSPRRLDNNPLISYDASILHPRFATGDSHLPGLTSADLRALQRALRERARRLSVEGVPVDYLPSAYLPARSRCLCVFRAFGRDAVERLNERAQVPFAGIDRAIDVPRT